MGRSRKRDEPPGSLTIEQASEFWDEHSLVDFEGTEKVNVHFRLRRKRYVGIDTDMFKKLEARARRKNLTVEALLETWIADRTR